MISIKQRLQALAEPDYRAFQAGLLPGVDLSLIHI